MSGTTSHAPIAAYRRPRFRILANGTPLIGGFETTITSNNFYQADRFTASVAMLADPAFNPAWWASQAEIAIEIQAGLLPDGAQEGSLPWQSLFVGTVDHLQMDLVDGAVHIEGRDLTSLLIEAKTQETFANQTASQVATTLALRHGLTPVVTATTTIIGQYYQLEHDRLTLNNFSKQTTEHDLLTYLAGEEGFDYFIKGNSLYFQPPTTGTSNSILIQYQPATAGFASPTMDITSLNLERSLTLARDIKVTVKSWNAQQGKSFVRVVNAAGGASQKSSGVPQNYVFVKPGLTPDAALKFANAKLKELTQHERVIRIEMPGELNMDARTLVNVAGTQTAFDQQYFVDSIERSISFESGFTQTVRAKNTSPRSQTTVQ